MTPLRPRSRAALPGAALVLAFALAACIQNPVRPAEVGPPATSVVPPELVPGRSPVPRPSPQVFGPVPSPAASPVASPTPPRLTPAPAASPTG